jgi:hypothetical protein
MKGRMRMVAIAVSLTGLLLVSPGVAQAGFGLDPGKLSITAEDSDGTIDTQAGSHPYALTVNFQLNMDEAGHSEGGELRDVIVDLPPGLIGNPQAVPRCPRQKFEGGTPQCPFETQVGVLKGTVPGFGTATGPIYNLEPPPGVAAQLGFSLFGFNALLNGLVRTEDGYGLSTSNPNVPINLTVANAEIWGTPAASGHDADRGRGLPGEPPHSSGAPAVPFLTMPANCSAPLEYTVEVDSKEAPGQFVGETVKSTDAGGNPAALAGCESVPFSPDISATTSSSAESASGLGFELKLPNKGLLSPGAITETEPEKTEVTLPAGVTINPAAASGLSACSAAQFKTESAESLPGQGCPAASKIGTLFAETPLLEEPIEGSVYVASPHDNPFGSLLAIYIVARAPERGVLVKQAGEVVADPVTGQLRTTVEGLPPVPYSSFQLQLREGPRAPLITPRLCGTYITQAKLYPFSQPDTPVERTAPFKVVSGAGGAGCAPSEAALPNAPSLQAGTVSPLAGAYSPFLFKVSRSDGEQRFSAIDATLPTGLVGKLAGVPYCSEAQIAAAQSRSSEGGGAAELLSPSCPQASQVGVVNVAAGAGAQPLLVQGKAYLAGPYKGAPLSMAIVTPAVAGPFDLGVVVVRTALYVDESSAQISVKSDPIPQILQGIPLDVRSVAVQVDRDSFTLNPTSCEAKAITGSVTSTTGAAAQLTNRFRVGGCAGLGFKPKLALSLKGGTKRAKHPALKAIVTYPQGDYANIAKAAVTLPKAEFIDQNHINNPCTRVQFRAQACPAASVLGRARAFTPLLDKPVEGPVYFRSSGDERELPDLVADLNGQIHLVLVGFIDSVGKKGSEVSRLRTTFATVPDAPVSRFVLELNSGKRKGALVNSEDLCKKPQRAVAKFTGQNGKVLMLNPTIANSCGGKGKKGKQQGEG